MLKKTFLLILSLTIIVILVLYLKGITIEKTDVKALPRSEEESGKLNFSTGPVKLTEARPLPRKNQPNWFLIPSTCFFQDKGYVNYLFSVGD